MPIKWRYDRKWALWNYFISDMPCDHSMTTATILFTGHLVTTHWQHAVERRVFVSQPEPRHPGPRIKNIDRLHFVSHFQIFFIRYHWHCCQCLWPCVLVSGGLRWAPVGSGTGQRPDTKHNFIAPIFCHSATLLAYRLSLGISSINSQIVGIFLFSCHTYLTAQIVQPQSLFIVPFLH